MSAPPPGILWTTVSSLEAFAPDRGNIAAFAIDTPRPGDRTPGAGLEINGWAIGRDATLSGMRAVVNGEAGKVVPLNVRRPDVAADYPQFLHAVSSGFSFWTPFDSREGSWHIEIEVLLGDAAPVTLAEIRGLAAIETPQPRRDARIVRRPDFAIIGAQRGGTTSLHAYLSAHPLVVSPPTKELHFLTDRHERGRDWYLGQFPVEVPRGALTGDATPYALFHPHAPRRLREITPRAKLIVLLRNPVERAYSHYLMERSRGDETLSFEAAIDAEPARLEREVAILAADPAYVSDLHKHASYLSRGVYAPQLERWFGEFSRDQFLIVRSEDLYHRTAETFAQIEAFLELPGADSVSFVAHNRTTGPPLNTAVRDRLSRHFAPLNARLADLLGWDPGWD